MIFYDTLRQIEFMTHTLPSSFVFLLDTADRNFLYASKDSADCKQLIYSLDRTVGLEKVTQDSPYYAYEEGNSQVKFLRTAANTFLGVCFPKGKYSENQLELVEEYFQTGVLKEF